MTTIPSDVVRELLNRSLEQLIEHDAILLTNDVSERSITHRIAVYLERELRNRPESEINCLDVDCEYNRNVELGVGSPKKLILNSETRRDSLLREGASEEEVLSVSSFPDIIVHRRGKNDANFLVVEVKKANSRVDE